ncbi:hypothetical protein [uncultured Tateyamaria sp.]|uniref:hypothetical protein n=1 Tax=uncultured Tateyamaria sp. TaxID=455651 RepID=UPI002617E56A|nr:hypothetical protein [uncultured Tateyamaria sp.]
MALVLGCVLPLHWGVLGFLSGALVLFVVQVTINAATGFAGESIEDSLLLFNGSWVAYIGFNLQISYRAFAVPAIALAAALIFRLGRAAS